MIDEEAGLVPDHLGLELLFMSYLIDNMRVYEQKKFLEEHLRGWVPRYCDEVREHAATVFYRELAHLVGEFIESESELLSGGA